MVSLRRNLRPLFGYAHKGVVAILQTKSVKEFSQTPKECVSDDPFSFAIESYLYETGFTPGPSQNYHS